MTSKADSCAHEPLTRDLVWMFAIGCGITVANLYYVQPLLSEMAQFWKTSEAQMGTIAALTTGGYGCGLLLFVPLGDIIERRRLILFFITAITMLLVALATSGNLTVLAILSFALGAFTIVPQLIIPLAASLASPTQRGSVIGIMQSGLLIGILVSRSIGGFAGDHWGWRSVYWLSAAINVLLLITFVFRLPQKEPSSKISYLELLRSTLSIVFTERIVRTSAFIGAMTFGSFCAFWTSLSFFASGAPYFYSPDKIGLFGLIGASGVLAAPVAGRLADKRGPMFGIGVSLVLVLLSYVILAFFAGNLLGLIVGVIVLDMAAHSSQVSNMARIYSLNAQMHNRVNTIYMFSYFMGGSLGAWAGTFGWTHWGWAGVCVAGASFPLLGLLLFLFISARDRKL